MSSCIYVDYDGEAPPIYREALRRARKEHRCTECGDAIAAGDLYEHVTGLWYGSFQTFRTCARCLNVRADYFDAWTFGGMVEDFWSAYSVDYREGIPEHITPCRTNSKRDAHPPK